MGRALKKNIISGLILNGGQLNILFFKIVANFLVPRFLLTLGRENDKPPHGTLGIHLGNTTVVFFFSCWSTRFTLKCEPLIHWQMFREEYYCWKLQICP